ncbi:MAG TPA: pilus assembly protein N-terminal domain-containing protein [Xanthobacteraceae bacterium]|nr:pilus assembly protein N-terminal domain-containing protein [Xanthobacteraceae bacterium]
MTAFCARGALIWLFTAVLLAAAPALADEPITVHLDQARILKLPDRATTVVIGDPLIADVSIQPGGLAVLTGKGYGETNVVVLDKGSAVLMEKTIEVKAPVEPLVMVWRGPTRQTYSCTPECSPRATLGDTGKEDIDKDTQLPTDFFAKTLNQGVTRSNQALAAGGAH